jgi:hypothetical protein
MTQTLVLTFHAVPLAGAVLSAWLIYRTHAAEG